MTRADAPVNRVTLPAASARRPRPPTRFPIAFGLCQISASRRCRLTVGAAQVLVLELRAVGELHLGSGAFHGLECRQRLGAELDLFLDGGAGLDGDLEILAAILV